MTALLGISLRAAPGTAASCWAGGAVDRAEHAAAAGHRAAAAGRAGQLLAGGVGHRPDRRRAHRAGAAAAVRGVPHRRRHQQHPLSAAPQAIAQHRGGGLDGAAEPGRQPPRLCRCWAPPPATSSTSATARSSAWCWPRASLRRWRLYDTVVGAEVARRLGYTLGQRIVLSHGDGAMQANDHADKPFTIVGILAPTGTPVDRTVHISLQAMEAIHVDWQVGAPLPGQAVSAEQAAQMDLTPTHHHRRAGGSEEPGRGVRGAARRGRLPRRAAAGHPARRGAR
jgi:hypothetical protein